VLIPIWSCSNNNPASAPGQSDKFSPTKAQHWHINIIEHIASAAVERLLQCQLLMAVVSVISPVQHQACPALSHSLTLHMQYDETSYDVAGQMGLQITAMIMLISLPQPHWGPLSP